MLSERAKGKRKATFQINIQEDYPEEISIRFSESTVDDLIIELDERYTVQDLRVLVRSPPQMSKYFIISFMNT